METRDKMSQIRHFTPRRFTPRFYSMIDAALCSIESATFNPATFYLFILQCPLCENARGKMSHHKISSQVAVEDNNRSLSHHVSASQVVQLVCDLK